MSELLKTLENEVQLFALAFLGVAYLIRLIWTLHFRASQEMAYAIGAPHIGAAYSLMNVFMPWTMESAREDLSFYVQFVILHIGIATAITVTFIIPYWPDLLEHNIIVRMFQLLLGAAFAVGIIRLIRRFTVPKMRLISTPDDYFSLILLNVFFVTGFFAVPNKYQVSEWPLIIFFAVTAFFLIYVPFSKISHYVYYPFTRYYFGKSMGHRGVLPHKKGKGKTTD